MFNPSLFNNSHNKEQNPLIQQVDIQMMMDSKDYPRFQTKAHFIVNQEQKRGYYITNSRNKDNNKNNGKIYNYNDNINNFIFKGSSNSTL